MSNFTRVSETEERFDFSIPVEISKSDNSSPDKPNDAQRKIKGLASSSAKDLQGEIIDQKGIDFTYFLKHGVLNDNHGSAVSDIIGQPTACKLTKDGLFIEGFLFKNLKAADSWWELLNSLEQSNSTRKAAFSIEGRVTRRDNNVIKGCWLKACALTMSPVNTTSWLEIAKSLSNEKFCQQPWLEKGCTCCGPEPQSCDVKDAHKDSCKCKEMEEKALTAGGMGRGLIPQSLEGTNKVTTYKSNNLSFNEAIEIVQKSQGCSLPIARAIVDAIFTSNGIT